MASHLRFLAFCLLLNLSLPAVAGTGIGKDELDAQKELLLLKIDGNKEVLQKDMEAQSKRIDAVDKRVDDQVNRFGDLGFFAGIISSLITVVLALGGIFGYLSVAKKAREEAETASKKWFDDNHQALKERIHELEHAAARAHETIDSKVADVETHRQSAMETMQKSISSGAANKPEISAADAEGLRASVKQLKGKPEANYSFDDWNTRAFAAYEAKQYEDAALFWKYAAEVPNAGASNTTQVLFNRALSLNELKRSEEAITTYTQLIDTYSSDTALAIRELVARSMHNKAVTLGKLGKYDEVITLLDQLITTYADDTAPTILEQVVDALNGRGFTRLMMAKQSWANRDPALTALQRAEADLQACLAQKPHWGMALGNLAYVQWLLQRPAESEAAFRTALMSKEHGGEWLRNETLRDIAQYPIPEDAGFKDMLERLWVKHLEQSPDSH